jgi:hypothetical protein
LIVAPVSRTTRPRFVGELLNGRQQILEHRYRAELYISADLR